MTKKHRVNSLKLVFFLQSRNLVSLEQTLAVGENSTGASQVCRMFARGAGCDSSPSFSKDGLCCVFCTVPSLVFADFFFFLLVSMLIPFGLKS